MTQTKPAITAKELLKRVQAVNVHNGAIAGGALTERLVAVEDMLNFMTGKKSYALGWVEQAEKEIREHHKKFGPRMGRIPRNAIITEEPGGFPPCDCGVCREVGA